ncbi:MAG TPA: GH116 family glycosyl-hydrolase, partial [Chryseosolibacter sp.]|nr:GH116 family glycosyl-hydrolase [Chryseosolibacter sp.]
MKKSTGRRTFLKKISISSITAGVLPAALMESGQAEAKGSEGSRVNSRKQKGGRQYNEAYEGAHLNRVAFPIGGMGAGMFCLEGTGAISHMSVRNKPDVFNEPGMFGAIAVKGDATTAKIVEGPSPDWKRFGQPNSGNGSGGTIFGLPRFDKASFLTRFPFGHITLEDDGFPLKAEIKGWSPFIPTDADNSGLPAGALEYKFVNNGNSRADCVFSFHAKNFIKHADGGINTVKKFRNGFILSNTGTEEKPFLGGDFVIFSDQDNTVVDNCWFRGGWFDPLTITWETII